MGRSCQAHGTAYQRPGGDRTSTTYVPLQLQVDEWKQTPSDKTPHYSDVPRVSLPPLLGRCC